MQENFLMLSLDLVMQEDRMKSELFAILYPASICTCSFSLLTLSQFFPNIQKLILSHLNQDELIMVSKKLKNLKQLKYLIIYCECAFDNEQIQAPIFIDLFLSNTNLQSFQYETGDSNSGEDPHSGKTKYFTPSSFYPTSTKTILLQLTDITISIQKFQDII